MRLKKKNRSDIYDTNRRRPMDTNILNIKCTNMMMNIYIKQHLSNILSSIHEKDKQHWGWVEKSVADITSV